jgi:ribosomal protein S1
MSFVSIVLPCGKSSFQINRSTSKRMVTRGGRDSSVSSADSALPEPGSVVKGEVSRVTDFGAFVQIPGFADGLIHVTRIDEAGRRLFTANDVRKRVAEGQSVFAKVLKADKGKVVLDFRFVDQTDGFDRDRHDEKRTELDGEKVRTDKFGDAQKDMPEVNKVYSGTVHSLMKFGCFVAIGDKFKHGLLPTPKSTKNLRIGDPLFVKVVEVLSGKYNVDMRYVDQETGEDLDTKNIHSSEKILAERRRSRSPRRDHSRSPRRERSRSPRRERSRTRRDRSSSVIVRRRRDRSRSSDSLIRRPRHDDVIRRRR